MATTAADRRWVLVEAVGLCQDLNKIVWDLDYHVCLGGSVLTKGASNKDVDIYILPVREHEKHELSKVVLLLNEYLGVEGVPMSEYKYSPICFDLQLKYIQEDGRRIDLFIGKSVVEEQADATP